MDEEELGREFGELDEQEEAAEQGAAEKAEAEKAEKEAAEKAEQESAKKQETVPLATYLEERNRLKAEIKELREQHAKYGGLEKELAELKGKLVANENKDEPPDFVQDPKGYIDHNVKSIAQKIREQEEKGQATEEQVKRQRMLQDLQQGIKVQVDAFSAKTEDFEDALQYAREVRLEELRDVYPEATEAQLQSALAVEEFRTAATLVQQGRNPGEFIYKWAQRRGYKGEEPVKDEDEEKRKMAEAREKAEGLGAGSGDAETIEVDADEFDQAMKEVFG